MKKRLVALGLALMFVLSACGGGGEDDVAENANTEVEGNVMIYTSMYEDIIDQIQPKVDAMFPNVEIEFFQGGTGAIQSKVAAEMESGQLDCDILMVAEPSYALELKEQDYLHAYKSPEAENINKLLEYDEEGYWYPVRISNMILAYNPEMTEKEDISPTLENFAFNDALEGKISMSNPLTSGTALASISGLKDAYGIEYFEALGDNKVAVESGSVALGKLETGECDEIMVLEESVLKKREEEDSPLEVIYPDDGTLVIPSPIMIIEESKSANKNMAACEAIEDWFLSEEGQQSIVDAWMHSVREDMKDTPPYDGAPTNDILSNELPIDWEATYKNREELRTEFENNVSVPES